MDLEDLRRWFDDYLQQFAACGRGQLDPAAMLEFSCRRDDGTEIGRLSATYVVAEAPSRRIRVLAVHGA